MLVINRDDAAGFRLDTITTSKQYTTPVVYGHDVLTTRTDYVNRHPSLLQTTSYNFSRIMTTPEVCIGVVKVPGLHQKNSIQHYEDLCMLEQAEDLKFAFVSPTGENKSIDCIRVDGAADEGPSHLEIQFLWTEWHWKKKKIATLVTTRCSGCSYMNRVELQNGCLSRGHSNTFIPSTLAGTCLDSSTGKISEEKVKENLSLAIDAYISRVDGCPCGDTTIKLYKGPDSTSRQKMHSKLTVFLEGSKKKKNYRVMTLNCITISVKYGASETPMWWMVFHLNTYSIYSVATRKIVSTHDANVGTLLLHLLGTLVAYY